MEELPYELLLEIFDYLSVSELGIASSVSRSWNELCSHQTLWKSRYLHALGTELINDPFSSYYGVLSPTIQPEEGYKKFLQKKLYNVEAGPILKLSILSNRLDNAKGVGNGSTISLLIPNDGRIASFAKMLSDEYATRSNIKTRVGRLCVLSAIVSVQQKLKLYQKVPPNGLIIYCGTICTEEGKEKKVSIDFEPPTWKGRPIINMESRYLCDNRFDTEFLKEAIKAPLAEIQEYQSSLVKRILRLYETQPNRFVLEDMETIDALLSEGKVETLLCWENSEWLRVSYQDSREDQNTISCFWKGKRSDIPDRPPNVESWMKVECWIDEVQEIIEFLSDKVRDTQPMTVLEILVPPFDSSTVCKELKEKIGGTHVVALLHPL